MARGTVMGETPISQANTPEFEDGYSRVFGEREPQRGRWVWDGERKELVRAEDYLPPTRALDAPILAGRFYENTRATDGADIGSRAKHREYMRRTGVTASSDFSPGWYERVRKDQRSKAAKSRREAVHRAFHEIDTGKLKPTRRGQE